MRGNWSALPARMIVIALILSAMVAGCGAPARQPGAPSGREAASPAKGSGPAVVASTSWTALMAKAAGAGDVAVLAPAELKHPPEYDFRPSDVDKLKDARLIVYAGYEPFMKKMLQAVQIPEDKVVQVATVNTPENLKKQTALLAEKLGTTGTQKAWEAEFDKTVSAIREGAAKQNVAGKRVLVQKHQSPFVKWLGYQVLAEFGPEELSPAKMGELAALRPDLVIDNFHNPQGQGIADMAKCPRVELRNFPAQEHKSLQDLIMDNARKLGLI
ncbi:MAG: zinc ABC transporter substrate-binding protein [Peptococcaceae bacterium]|nr:zinc ABC transporter substrate-binding protein [Peptococcaceae bacterium]